MTARLAGATGRMPRTPASAHFTADRGPAHLSVAPLASTLTPPQLCHSRTSQGTRLRRARRERAKRCGLLTKPSVVLHDFSIFAFRHGNRNLLPNAGLLVHKRNCVSPSGNHNIALRCE